MRRKFAVEGDERVGWVEYAPTEEALDAVAGEAVNHIHCLIDGRDYSGGGDAARVLLAAVEEDSAEEERGVSYSSHKFANLLVELGYGVVTGHDLGTLYLKATDPSQVVRFIETRVPEVQLEQGRVVVDLYWNYWCSDCAYGRGGDGLEGVRTACAEDGDAIVLREHELDRALIEQLGLGHNMSLIDGKNVSPFVCLTSKDWVRDAIQEARASSSS